MSTTIEVKILLLEGNLLLHINVVKSAELIYLPGKLCMLDRCRWDCRYRIGLLWFHLLSCQDLDNRSKTSLGKTCFHNCNLLSIFTRAAWFSLAASHSLHKPVVWSFSTTVSGGLLATYQATSGNLSGNLSQYWILSCLSLFSGLPSILFRSIRPFLYHLSPYTFITFLFEVFIHLIDCPILVFLWD